MARRAKGKCYGTLAVILVTCRISAPAVKVIRSALATAFSLVRRPVALLNTTPLNRSVLVRGANTMWRSYVLLVIVASSMCWAYDPEDDGLESVLPPGGQFEAFYQREAHGIPNGSSRPAHGHGSFYKHRNPALVDVKNAPAYGFRFDGKRRFNFDDE